VNDHERRYLTVAEVADQLHLSEISVRRKIRDGTIPAVRLARHGRGPIRIPEHELHRALDAVTPAGPGEAA
jgi:excisionase family DNA binding protein